MNDMKLWDYHEDSLAIDVRIHVTNYSEKCQKWRNSFSHMRVLIDKNMIIVLHILDFTLDLYLSKIYYEEILK